MKADEGNEPTDEEITAELNARLQLVNEKSENDRQARIEARLTLYGPDAGSTSSALRASAPIKKRLATYHATTLNSMRFYTHVHPDDIESALVAFCKDKKDKFSY